MYKYYMNDTCGRNAIDQSIKDKVELAVSTIIRSGH